MFNVSHFPHHLKSVTSNLYNSKTVARDLTGKSITMLCDFQDLQLKVYQFCLKLTYEKGLTWHFREPSRLYLLCDNGDVQYFCRVREEQLRFYLIFTSIKMHMFGKQSILSRKETISICCFHSVVKIILNF